VRPGVPRRSPSGCHACRVVRSLRLVYHGARSSRKNRRYPASLRARGVPLDGLHRLPLRAGMRP
jgi:hypothetical protein